MATMLEAQNAQQLPGVQRCTLRANLASTARLPSPRFELHKRGDASRTNLAIASVWMENATGLSIASIAK